MSEAYRKYVLAMLTLVYTISYLDRGLMTLLLQAIKDDLSLSDTQLGFLTGIAFGLFYATLGIPIARWADRGNRATIVSLAIGMWGVTVMSCVAVTSFAQLAAARVAAAIGESGCLPPTYSLLGDYFPAPSERTRAMSIYWLASPLASIGSFVAGGWLNERYGWRATFFLMGIPALIVAGIVKKTVVEPRQLPSQTSLKSPRIGEVLRILWWRPSTRHLSVGIILFLTMSTGLTPWYAAFMMRSHGMSTSEVGVWLGFIFGIGGIAGNLFGTYVATRWYSGDERAQMRLSALMIASLFPCFILFLLLPQKRYALLALIPLIVIFSFSVGPIFTLMQRLVTSDMRATTLAVVMLLGNLIGMGVGPQIVGVISDLLRSAAGKDSLRYAMLAMSAVALWAAYHFWRVGQTVVYDLAVLNDCSTTHTGSFINLAAESR